MKTQSAQDAVRSIQNTIGQLQHALGEIDARSAMLVRYKKLFERKPTNGSAYRYMALLMKLESYDELGDDEWLNGLTSIRDYLNLTAR